MEEELKVESDNEEKQKESINKEKIADDLSGEFVDKYLTEAVQMYHDLQAKRKQKEISQKTIEKNNEKILSPSPVDNESPSEEPIEEDQEIFENVIFIIF